MKVNKAVITAAGPDHHLPLQRLVNRRGEEKTALQLILDEVGQAGIEEIAVIVRPGDSEAFRDAAGDHAASLTFLEQTNPRGYGDAIHRAAGFVGRRAVSVSRGRSSLPQRKDQRGRGEVLRRPARGDGARKKSAPFRRCRPRARTCSLTSARSAAAASPGTTSCMKSRR